MRRVFHNWIFNCLFLLILPILAACTSRISSQSDTMLVPAGWFDMGQNDDRRSNTPRHRVYLDAFFIQHTEVTREQFALFLKESDYQPAHIRLKELQEDRKGKRNLPITRVVWQDAHTYCQWIGMRLPTEAEWEKAARGTDGRRFPWGGDWEPGCANTAENGPGRVQPVGSYPDCPSPYGALDMAGNAAEWVADNFSFDYYQHAPQRNPTGPPGTRGHGLRGGSWASPWEHAQTYFRDSSHSVQSNPRIGFRCAVSLVE